MGVKYSKTIWPDEYVANLLHPVVRKWIFSTFGTLTEIQRRAVPLIHEGKNVLMISPTGSGKTLAAFLSAINELFWMASRGELEDGVYVLYVSPLRALSNDIRRNLSQPIEGMRKIAEDLGLKVQEIRYFVRTGDTTQNERAKMLKRPPHILITTPETLAIVLSSRKFRYHLKKIKYVIIDEIHELCSSKRGVHLSISLERLREFLGREFTRIGLSATQAPIEEIARFLVGGTYEKGEWKEREVYIVKSLMSKDIDLEVIAPGDLISEGSEAVNRKMYSILKKLIQRHRTTLVFTNTRSGAESVAYKLKEMGIDSLGTHHSSLSREVRLDIEESLKKGKLKAVVTSTSLELGIDIGYIDLVCQIGSPKSVAKGLQRIGRSGHALHANPKGKFIAINRGDIMECAVISKCAKEGKIDRVQIPKLCLDVLAQHLVGMSLEKKWRIEEAYATIKRAYPYRDLTFEEFMDVLRYLGGKYSGLEDLGVYRKLWLDLETGEFGRKKGSTVIYNLNVGTIPDETNYKVIMEGTRRIIGFLSEDFVSRLIPGDIFVLAGSTYEFVRCKGTKVYVRNAAGRRPTIPSWIGEMLPRSYDLSIEVGKFRRELEKRVGEVILGKRKRSEIISWLREEYYLNRKGAEIMFEWAKEQISYLGFIPRHEIPLVEHFYDENGRSHLIFHFPYGRRVNDALSRAYATILSDKFKTNVKITISDDGFVLSFPRALPESYREAVKSLKPEELEELLKRNVRRTELFKQRFRHCAVRSFMVLRNYKGHEISASNQYLKSSNLLRYLESEDFPVLRETYREILYQYMDLEHAVEVLSKISSGEWKLRFYGPTEAPCPFSHEILVIGMEDIVMMEDRAEMLREFKRRVLARILNERAEFKDQKYIEAYFKMKRRESYPGIDKGDLREILERCFPVPMAGRSSIYERMKTDPRVVRKWIASMLRKGEITTIFLGRRMLIPKWAERYYMAFLEPDFELAEKFAGKRLSEISQEERLEARRAESTGALRINADGRGNFYYELREDFERERKREAAKALIRQVLYCYGPMTYDELVAELRIRDKEVEKALNDLIREGEVVKGYFIPGEEEMQYMLREDRENLSSSLPLENSLVAYAKSYSYREKICEIEKDIFGDTSVASMFLRSKEKLKEVEFLNWKGEKERAKLPISEGDWIKDLKEEAPIYVVRKGSQLESFLIGERKECDAYLVFGRKIIGYLRGKRLEIRRGLKEALRNLNLEDLLKYFNKDVI